MNVLISLATVVVLFLAGLVGAVVGLQAVFGIVIPYLAVALFLGGLVYQVMKWADIPVPFRIPTTCGQAKSLPWIKRSRLESPFTALDVAGRMFLEVLAFRSLLRNTRAELREDGRPVYGTALGLWAGALAFHWTMLAILVRHLRFFTQPVPFFITFLQEADGVLEVGAPVFFVTSFVFLAALAYLLARRLTIPQVRYISLANDYFPLFLLLGIGVSGVWLRHLTKTDITEVKELVVGLATFRPSLMAAKGIASLFYGHLFLVCVLLAYFPFSKLLHAPGVFLSPTRNLANNNRAVRHVNPWDYPVKTHSYAEYEDEWRDKMKVAGVPVDKDK
ncbi:MAG: sulfate reduction electron transfer complex DsrMKJOP subunit DsrM [Planctomycetota bacterium]